MSATMCPIPATFKSAGVEYETVAFKERDVGEGWLVLAYCPEADALYRGRFHRLFGASHMRWDAPARYADEVVELGAHWRLEWVTHTRSFRRGATSKSTIWRRVRVLGMTR